MGGPAENLAIAKRYLKAIESEAAGDEIGQFFAPEIVVEILPSLYFPQGSRDGIEGIRTSYERGKKVMLSQKYGIKNEISAGDQVALEVDWTGTLAVPFQNIAKGGQMRAHFAMFLRFRGGKIIFQRNYDCYEPS